MAETLKPLETPASLADIKNELTSVPDTLLADTVEVHSELPYAPNARFQPEKVRQIIERILKEKLGPLPAYDFETAPAMAREIADHVKNEVRDLGYQRYRIVVQSVVGESKDQGFQFASRCLWDPKTDDHSFGSFLNGKVFGVVGVWALYLT
nr:tctex1 domain-containing protein 2-like [Physcomitrium patens]|eukprot:XP_024379750.1 tctex1 domain-containing protein 2-like [Physcomitrella patens]